MGIAVTSRLIETSPGLGAHASRVLLPRAAISRVKSQTLVLNVYAWNSTAYAAFDLSATS
jgi:hypothetical protein